VEDHLGPFPAQQRVDEPSVADVADEQGHAPPDRFADILLTPGGEIVQDHYFVPAPEHGVDDV
jgi:hypothetical protein